MMKKSSCFLVGLFLFSCCCFSFAWATEQSPRIAILPFTVHAAKEMSYIQAGVREMLASRLAARVGAEILTASAVDQAVAATGLPQAPAAYQALAGQLAADYIVGGSLTSFAGATSIDAAVHPAQSGKASHNFSVNAKTESDLLTAVNTLTWDIAETTFGVQRPTPKPSLAGPPSTPVPAANPYATAHPDRQFLGGAYGGQGGSVVRPLGVITGPMGFTKSQNLSLALVSMAVGDVDNDGVDEFVLASRREVRVYRQVGRQLQQIGKVETPYNQYAVHSVSIGDTNQNGTKEICVSVANTREPLSFVLEWNGSAFTKIAEQVNWYIRAVDLPGEGMQLLGQKSSMNNLLSPGLYRLTISGSSVLKGDKLQVRGVNLFDFTLADIDADGKNEMLAVSQGDKLLVLRTNGKLDWMSDEFYGGTTRFIGGENADDLSTNLEYGNTAPRIYIPARIVVRDLNKDGHLDVLVNKNQSTASRLLSRYKSYPSGEIHALTWNGIGLTELWRTRKIDGYVADYELGPTHEVSEKNADGLVEKKQVANLYVGVVLGGSGLNFLSDARSTVLTFPIEIAHLNQESSN